MTTAPTTPKSDGEKLGGDDPSPAAPFVTAPSRLAPLMTSPSTLPPPAPALGADEA